jgi:hypothetical protein
MPIEYTNRKGVTYYLCQRETKTGKTTYFFAREAKEDSPEAIPEGFKISESVNGKVSLARDRPPQIFPEELAVVEKAISQHPESDEYRAGVKQKQIVIYQRQGPDVESLTSLLVSMTRKSQEEVRRILKETVLDSAPFSPIMRFILIDAEKRTFKVERWSFMGGIDDWIDTWEEGALEDLGSRLVPMLGTDDFYELY